MLQKHLEYTGLIGMPVADALTALRRVMAKDLTGSATPMPTGGNGRGMSRRVANRRASANSSAPRAKMTKVPPWTCSVAG